MPGPPNNKRTPQLPTTKALSHPSYQHQQRTASAPSRQPPTTNRPTQPMFAVNHMPQMFYVNQNIMYEHQQASPRDFPMVPQFPQVPVQPSSASHGLLYNNDPAALYAANTEYVAGYKSAALPVSSPVTTSMPAVDVNSTLGSVNWQMMPLESPLSGPSPIGETESPFGVKPPFDFPYEPNQQFSAAWLHNNQYDSTTPNMLYEQSPGLVASSSSSSTPSTTPHNHSHNSHQSHSQQQQQQHQHTHHRRQSDSVIPVYASVPASQEWYSDQQQPLAPASTSEHSFCSGQDDDGYHLSESDESSSPVPLNPFVSSPYQLDMALSGDHSAHGPTAGGSDSSQTMEKKYQCQICGKFFRRDLPRHLRTHQEVARFTCPYPRDRCPHKRGQFNRPYDFKKHLLHAHFTFDDQKRVRSFRNLRSKLAHTGTCACGRRFTANEWLDEHVLDGQLRCELLIPVAAMDNLAATRGSSSSASSMK